MRVCATCPTPRLNLSSELRPSGNNIQDTFLIGSATDTTRYPRNWTPYSSIRGHRGNLPPPFLGWNEKKAVDQLMQNFSYSLRDEVSA